MNRFMSTISCRDTDEGNSSYIPEPLDYEESEGLYPALTSGQALCGRPRYDLKLTLAGLMRVFIFSAVMLPNMNGTRGSASPWHCRMCMSLLTPPAEAWEYKRLGLFL